MCDGVDIIPIKVVNVSAFVINKLLLWGLKGVNIYKPGNILWGNMVMAWDIILHTELWQNTTNDSLLAIRSVSTSIYSGIPRKGRSDKNKLFMTHIINGMWHFTWQDIYPRHPLKWIFRVTKYTNLHLFCLHLSIFLFFLCERKIICFTGICATFPRL